MPFFLLFLFPSFSVAQTQFHHLHRLPAACGAIVHVGVTVCWCTCQPSPHIYDQVVRFQEMTRISFVFVASSRKSWKKSRMHVGLKDDSSCKKDNPYWKKKRQLTSLNIQTFSMRICTYCPPEQGAFLKRKVKRDTGLIIHYKISTLEGMNVHVQCMFGSESCCVCVLECKQ